MVCTGVAVVVDDPPAWSDAEVTSPSETSWDCRPPDALPFMKGFSSPMTASPSPSTLHPLRLPLPLPLPFPLLSSSPSPSFPIPQAKSTLTFPLPLSFSLPGLILSPPGPVKAVDDPTRGDSMPEDEEEGIGRWLEVEVEVSGLGLVLELAVGNV